jgi:hypothetical protein
MLKGLILKASHLCKKFASLLLCKTIDRQACVHPHRLLQHLSSQHTSAYVSIRQHASACVSIRQHASAYVNMRQHASEYVSMRQHTSEYVSIRRIRQRTSAYVSIRQQASAYVSRRQHTSGLGPCASPFPVPEEQRNY